MFAFYNSYKINMLVELCVSYYATFNGLVNGANGIFKASTAYCKKTIIWIMFQISKIGALTNEKYNHYYNINVEIFIYFNP